jgi:integrase
MLETGMRPEEVYRIRRENVSVAENRLFNPYGKTKAARRVIALTAAARGVLARRIVEAKDYLFPCESDSTRPVPKAKQCP